MVRNYVLSKYFLGSGKNVEIDVRQMSDGNSYSISDPVEFIADCIYSNLDTFIDCGYNVKKIARLISATGACRLAVSDPNVVAVVEIFADIDRQIYGYSMIQDDMKSRRTFEVSQIDDLSVGYLVSEHIVSPSDSCPLIERCYHKCFDELISAQIYLNRQMENYTLDHGSLEYSGYKLFVVDKKEIEQSKWYQTNLSIVDDVKKYDLVLDDYRYIEHIDTISAAILADAYDNLPEEEQANANEDIFDSLYALYEDDDMFEEYAADIQYAMDDDNYDLVEQITDKAILSALVLAPDEETFYKVHEVLGPYGYRVNALSDDVFNRYPNKGSILVSKNPIQLNWYADCAFINDWEGAIDSGYYHKFMPNTRDTLLCLREYHPELIVNTPPSNAVLTRYKNKYKEYMSETRGKHEEARFYVYEGQPVCEGTWYPRGLMSNKCCEDTVFFRKYFNYLISESDCKSLLSGEEIIITDYVSKEGFETTIRGKLKNTAGPFEENDTIGFSRTDIGSKERLLMNSELQINEPGLPDSEI